MSEVSAVIACIQYDFEPTLETLRGIEKRCTASAAGLRAVSAKVRSHADQLAACKESIRELKRISGALSSGDLRKATNSVTTGKCQHLRMFPDGEEKP